MKYNIQKNRKSELLNGAHGTYGAMLFDKRWREKRAHILKRDNNSCKVCKSPNELQVHHRQYHFIQKLRRFRKPWDYTDNLLITMCKTCHQKGHQLYKVPIKYI